MSAKGKLVIAHSRRFAMSQVVSQVCRELAWSVFEPVNELIRGSIGDQQSLVEHNLKVALERPAVGVGTKLLKILDGQASVFQDESQRGSLARAEAMLLNQHITDDDSFAALFDFIELCGQAIDEEVQPAGEVHALIANALDGRIKCWVVAVVVFADCEQSLEVVTLVAPSRESSLPTT